MKKAKGKLAKKLVKLNARILDWDATQSRLKSRCLDPTAYKKPGSMNQHK